MELSERVSRTILDVPDFPKPGIVFKDITPVLEDSELFCAVVDDVAERFRARNITRVAAIESRGFIFGAPIARALGVGLVLIRKPGKLPRATRSVTYDLEYGTDTLHVHADTLQADDRILIVDDVLATGGTAAAAAQLVRESGATVAGMGFLMELRFLKGRERLGAAAPVYSIVGY